MRLPLSLAVIRQSVPVVRTLAGHAGLLVKRHRLSWRKREQPPRPPRPGDAVGPSGLGGARQGEDGSACPALRLMVASPPLGPVSGPPAAAAAAGGR